MLNEIKKNNKNLLKSSWLSVDTTLYAFYEENNALKLTVNIKVCIVLRENNWNLSAGKVLVCFTGKICTF